MIDCKCNTLLVERKLELSDTEDGNRERSEGQKSKSIDDEITHVSLRIRFDDDRRGRMNSKRTNTDNSKKKNIGKTKKKKKKKCFFE